MLTPPLINILANKQETVAEVVVLSNSILQFSLPGNGTLRFSIGGHPVGNVVSFKGNMIHEVEVPGSTNSLEINALFTFAPENSGDTFISSINLKEVVKFPEHPLVNSFALVSNEIGGATILVSKILDRLPDFLPKNITKLDSFFAGLDISRLKGIENWDTSHVTSMYETFSHTSGWGDVNAPAIEKWDTSNATNMSRTFESAIDFNKDISSWDTSNVTNMERMFQECIVFNQNLSTWDVGNVEYFDGMFYMAETFNGKLNTWKPESAISFREMFAGCRNFNQNINSWGQYTGNVRNMSEMFSNCAKYNMPMNKWDTSNVTNMERMFDGCHEFNQSLDQWDTTSVTELSGIFNDCYKFNKSINTWDVGNVSDFSRVFSGCYKFNQPLDSWDMSSATKLTSMFSNCLEFNQDINAWDVRNVTTMENLFHVSETISGKTDPHGKFNQPLDQWRTESLTNLTNTFANQREFNQSLDSWDVSKVTTMHGLFRNCRNYNESMNSWNTESLIDLSYAFYWCHSFDQPLNHFDVSNVTTLESTFQGTTYFNKPLNNWDVSNVRNFSKTFHTAFDFNANGIGLDNWNTRSATDMSYMFYFCLGLGNTGQFETWNVTNVTNMSYIFAYTFYLNSNNKKSGNEPTFLTKWDTSNVINMKGMFKCSAFMHYDGLKNFMSVPGNRFNVIRVTDMSEMFSLMPDIPTKTDTNKTNAWMFLRDFRSDYFYLLCNGVDENKIPIVTEKYYEGNGYYYLDDDIPCSKLQALIFNSDNKEYDIRNFATYNVTDMSGMFEYNTGWSASNHPIETWNINRVHNFSRMFKGCHEYNGRLSDSKSAASDISYMFAYASSFNQPVTFNTSNNLSNLEGTFMYATSFNNGNNNTFFGITPSATTLRRTFYNAISFNRSVSHWNTSSVVNMEGTFGADIRYLESGDSGVQMTFNQPLAGWETRNVTTMKGMFENNAVFNQNINTWSTHSVTDMSYMFYNAKAFNSSLYAWNTAKVTNMSYMFAGTDRFNTGINTSSTSWNVSKVTNMEGMFMKAKAFNQPLDRWDTSNVTNINYMFRDTEVFNGDVTTWNVQRVVTAIETFAYSKAFNQDLSKWLLVHIVSISGFLRNNKVFNKGIPFCYVNSRSPLFYGGYQPSLEDASYAFAFMDNMVDLGTFFNNGWRVEKLKNAEGMFKNTRMTGNNQSYATLLTNMVAVENTESMFEGFRGQGTFGNYTRYNLPALKNAKSMFKGSSFERFNSASASNLVMISMPKIEDASYMFAETPNFNDVSINTWDLSNISKRDGLTGFLHNARSFKRSLTADTWNNLSAKFSKPDNFDTGSQLIELPLYWQPFS